MGSCRFKPKTVVKYRNFTDYYRKIKGACTSHQIRNEVIENLVLEKIQNLLAYIGRHESVFVRLVTEQSQEETERNVREGKRELEQAKARMSRLDDIIQKLYEDNLDGKITDERFSKMTANYEQEQAALESRVKTLIDMITTASAKTGAVESFLKMVRSTTEVRELTATIIREFIDKIYVHQAVKFNGHRIQQIDIAWNFIGVFDPPESDLEPTKGKTA